MIGQVGTKGLKQLKKTRKAFREEIYHSLKTGRVYVLGPSKQFVPKPSNQAPATTALDPDVERRGRRRGVAHGPGFDVFHPSLGHRFVGQPHGLLRLSLVIGRRHRRVATERRQPGLAQVDRLKGLIVARLIRNRIARHASRNGMAK